MLSVQDKILLETRKLEEQANLIYDSIENNLWNMQSQQGVLRRSYDQYASCIKIDHAMLK